MAADNNNPYAQYNLAILYIYGIGTDLKFDDAISLLEKSGEGGYTKAFIELGFND